MCYFLEVISCTINPVRSYNGLPSSHIRGLGIFTQFPSTTPLGLALGAGLPCADYPSTGTLGLSAAVSLTLLYVTYVSILTSDISSIPHRMPSQTYRTLRYRVILTITPTASVHGFSPGTFSARGGLTRPVSCYAFFKGWLLLSQPPGCLGLPTSFST